MCFANNHSFRMSRNFETQACQWCGIKQIKSTLACRGLSGTWFEAPVYYLKLFSLQTGELVER